MSTQTVSKQQRNNQDFVIVKKLATARFPVYLARSPKDNKFYALKVYPYEDGKVSKFYLNECHFVDLQHPNVISILECQQLKNSISNGKQIKISYILMEYAVNGDFYDLLMTRRITLDEKLVRTYFRQLIHGLEFLHSKGIAHMDIKPDNLLLDENFELKITDFDLSYYEGDEETTGAGTQYYRAPELIEGYCEDPQSADIYSAAIVLFVLKTGGKLPHTEHETYQGMNLCHMMHHDNPKFWKIHAQVQERPMSFFDEDFRTLFNMMTCLRPCDRAKIPDIKKTKWHNGPIYGKEELKNIMKKKLLMQNT